jgi:hypothetical protein
MTRPAKTCPKRPTHAATSHHAPRGFARSDGGKPSAEQDRATTRRFRGGSRPSPARGISRAVNFIFAKRERLRGSRRLSAALFGLAAASFSLSARADASSWFSIAGGAGAWTEGGTRQFPGALQLELGMGSSPARAVVVGGVAKSLSYFGKGTDLAFTLRGASGGFARGGFGFAIDAGAYQRWWGEDSSGFFGALVLGGPLGLQLTAMTEQGTNDVRAYAATLGIDFLRLTVYRNATGGYWPNPLLAPIEARR